MIRIGIVASLLAAAGMPHADTLTVQPESRVWLDGGSTVRSFTCQAAAVTGSVETSEALTEQNLTQATGDVILTVPVAQLGCGNGTMDEHMKKALKASQFKTIRYQQASLVAGANGALELTGTLEMAGMIRPITLTGTLSRDSDGALRLRGQKQLNMTEWGIKPPSLMMGTMKVKPNVVVNYDVVLRQP